MCDVIKNPNTQFVYISNIIGEKYFFLWYHEWGQMMFSAYIHTSRKTAKLVNIYESWFKHFKLLWYFRGNYITVRQTSYRNILLFEYVWGVRKWCLLYVNVSWHNLIFWYLFWDITEQLYFWHDLLKICVDVCVKVIFFFTSEPQCSLA